jgi:hypothetical protein
MESKTRRTFIGQTMALGTAACISSVGFAHSKTNRQTAESSLDQWSFDHNWAKLPDKFTWQTTHNVAVDSQNRVYVIHEGHANKPDHPAIFVFDEDGKYIKSFGSQFQGGGHGIEIHKENGEEFIYVCAYQQLKTFAKLTLDGEVIWQHFAPMQAKIYAEGKASDPKGVWGRDRFMPTNFAFLPDGDFLLADGYGSWFIHRYDRDGNWKSKFGGPGQGKGTFDTPHGIWIDSRSENPKIVVADRAHHTLQVFSIDGEYLETITGFGLPANIDIREKVMLVPELLGRVSLLDENNNVVAQLGDDSQRIKADSQHAIRSKPDMWQQGKFVHPHDACFDQAGNIFVAEWVSTGRITKLSPK